MSYTKEQRKAQKIFLKALTSGEYTQLKSGAFFARGDTRECSFCLIGVAMNELAIINNKDFSIDSHFEVNNWLGDDLFDIEISGSITATRCNDRTDMTFLQIAKLLKKYWNR